MVLNGIEWYYKLPLRIPLSPTEIPLNGPTVLNGIQWYSMVFNGIPLALFVRVVGSNIVMVYFVTCQN